LRKLYNLSLSSDREFARKIRQITGVIPRDIELYKIAFYHRSGSNGRDLGKASNERLEFLGDAILSCAVGEYLFKKYPMGDEGFLTKMRSKIVKRQTLNAIAEQMGLDLFLLEFNQTDLSNSMLGNSLEALLGAFYLENGYEKTKAFISRKIIRKQLNLKKLEDLDDNFKSQLLEWSQREGVKIRYQVLDKFKKNNRDHFKVSVIVNNNEVATAEDYNKKSAEQQASRKALELLTSHKEEVE
jgi:ribonuclease-3